MAFMMDLVDIVFGLFWFLVGFYPGDLTEYIFCNASFLRTRSRSNQ